MNQNDTFKATIKVHELNDVLVENDVDEENGVYCILKRGQNFRNCN